MRPPSRKLSARPSAREREGETTHPRLEVDEQGARDVVVIVGLVEEDVFPVRDLACGWDRRGRPRRCGCRPVEAACRGGWVARVLFEGALAVYAVLEAELGPELGADWGEGRRWAREGNMKVRAGV